VAFEYTITRQVEFSETDTAGMVHFSNFFRYMEAAEHAFFRSLGFSIHGGECGFPRVHADCDYRVPLRFEDTFEVRLLVRERREKSLSYCFVFRKLNGGPPVEVARGSLTVVCVRVDPASRKLSSVPIPDSIASRIEPAPPELLAQ
jgi:YbgC/YbaW family acyl-CoA thioester hydrolase